MTDQQKNEKILIEYGFEEDIARSMWFKWSSACKHECHRCHSSSYNAHRCGECGEEHRCVNITREAEASADHDMFCRLLRKYGVDVIKIPDRGNRWL